jgi:hypothetical protein
MLPKKKLSELPGSLKVKVAAVREMCQEMYAEN